MPDTLIARVHALKARLGPPFDSKEGFQRLAHLLAAHTEEEHRRAAAEVTMFLFRLVRKSGLPETFTSKGSAAAELESVLKRAPDRGAGKKPPRDQRALLDASFMFSLAGDFTTHMRAMAACENITEAAARRRIEKAEKLTGFRLPRRAPFVVSSQKKDH